MAMHLKVEGEDVPLVAAAGAPEATVSQPQGVGRLRLVVPAAFVGLLVLGAAALRLPQTAGGQVKSETVQKHALSAVAQANLTEASELWGYGPQNCMQCQASGGSCCVDQPLVCCNGQQICNLGRCAPLGARRPMGAQPMPGGGRPMYGGGQPGYGYGGQPGYGSGGPSMMQRLSSWFSQLNPFNSQQPNPMYGSGGNGGGYGGQGPSLQQRLGGSMLSHLLR